MSKKEVAFLEDRLYYSQSEPFKGFSNSSEWQEKSRPSKKPLLICTCKPGIFCWQVTPDPHSVQYRQVWYTNFKVGGSGATWPLPRDGGVKELYGDPTVGPRPKVWARGQKWAEMARQLSRRVRPSNHPQSSGTSGLDHWNVLDRVRTLEWTGMVRQLFWRVRPSVHPQSS